MANLDLKQTKLNGWLIVDKPLNISSNHVLTKLKRQFNIKKLGHAGTLDPLASGVLVVAVGEATKLCRYAISDDKSYEFTVQFGDSTDTDDAEGDVIASNQLPLPKSEVISAALEQFIGAIQQVPPRYSAIKINGRRSYDIARKGLDNNAESPAKPSAREVVINTFELTNHDTAQRQASFRVHCGKGTYVRSLARDLAHALGSYGYVLKLRRIASGIFNLSQATTLDNLLKLSYTDLAQLMLGVDCVLDDIPVHQLTTSEQQAVICGKAITLPPNFVSNQMVRAKAAGKLVAILLPKGNLWQPQRVFNL
ncbi:MAG: tRNA pseudouridine(55) synthase TruB [Pseudomonadota bacterium]